MEDNFSKSQIKNNKGKSGLKFFAIIFFTFIFILTAVYTVFTVMSVRERMKIAVFSSGNEINVDNSMIDLLKEKAWIESRLKMSTSDSVGLSIDLEKHLIQLELKGVVVLSSRIRDYSTSGFFKKMDGNVYFSMFGSPLSIVKLESSIEKNPFKTIKAPANAEELEATTSTTKKDSISKENVYWTVILDKNIELNIQGIDSVADSNSKYKLGKDFEFHRNLRNISQSIVSILKFSKPVYTPEILISIPENEAKAILRAIPRKSLVTIKI